MSRIGNKLITLPEGLNVTIGEGFVEIKGKVGEDKIAFDPSILKVEHEGNTLKVVRANDEKKTKALHGTTRALLQNAVIGCSQGFTKKLAVIGIGYRAEMEGNNIVLHVGYSHAITVKPLPGVKISVTESKSKNTNCFIEVSGSDKFAVGQVAAEIRATREPENYLGKGVRYVDEYVIIKEGKRAGKK